MAKHKQKKSDNVPNMSVTQSSYVFPAISVIIPMYNAEKYIGKCLDSILAQTFQNFEIIVVDDCSTDNSYAIVESYKEKFGGRLTLMRMEQNTGGGGFPRNRGLLFSRGEYIYFMDSDDMIRDNAFKEMYTLAKQFNADIMHYIKSYDANDDGLILKLDSNRVYGSMNKVLVNDDLLYRLNLIVKDGFWYAPWRYFIKRDLIAEHEIFFPKITILEDQIFIRNLLFHAKRLLIVPNALYIYRQSVNSVMRSKRELLQGIKVSLESTIIATKLLANTMNKIEFFRSNRNHTYTILQHFLFGQLYRFFHEYNEKSSADIYEAIKFNFAERLGENDVLVSMLLTILKSQYKINVTNQYKFNQFATAANKRIAELEAEIKRLKSK